MPRGGRREGSGAKSKWKHGKTTSIRVPIALVDEILEIAHQIDDGTFLSNKGSFKTINLAGISIISYKGKKGVIISDLMKAGYNIEPPELAMFIERVDFIRSVFSKPT